MGDPKSEPSSSTHIIHLFPKMRVITLTILALTSIVSAEDSYASQCDAVTGRIMERCTKQVRRHGVVVGLNSNISTIEQEEKLILIISNYTRKIKGLIAYLTTISLI